MLIHFFSLVLALRLMTLNSLVDNDKLLFLMNKDSKLIFHRITLENIQDFYVVKYKGRIFFYTRGNYHSFVYAEDGISLKLAPVNLGRIQFYTQESDPVRKIKIVKWDDLVKKKTENVQEAVEPKDTRVKKHRKVNEEIFNGLHNSITNNSTGGLNQNNRIRVDSVGRNIQNDVYSDNSNAAMGDYSKNTYSDHNSNAILIDHRNDAYPIYNNNTNNSRGKEEILVHHTTEHVDCDEIESDSQVIDSRSPKIEIKTVDLRKKTFVLKNEKEMCVTYFEKAFIMAECTKSTRQVFRLVEVEEIMKKLQKKESKNESVVTDVVEEIDQENEEGALVDAPSQAKPERVYVSESTPRVSNETETRPDPRMNIPRINPAATRQRVPEPNIQPRIQTKVRVNTPVKYNRQYICRQLFNRSQGRAEGIPADCQVLLGLRPVINRQASSVQEDTATKERRKSLNMIERLERALGPGLI